MCGLGCYTWSDGRVYEGEFADNNASGFGILWRRNEHSNCLCAVLKGRWLNGKFEERRPVPLIKIPNAWEGRVKFGSSEILCRTLKMNLSRTRDRSYMEYRTVRFNSHTNNSILNERIG